MEKKAFYKAIYGENENDYFVINENELNEYEKEQGFLSEATAFRKIFSDMILSNNILRHINYDNIDFLIDSYNEENDEYTDEYQYFIVEPRYSDEETLIKLVKSTGNTLYYSNDLDNYILGVTDLGTNRNYVLTDIKLEKMEA